MNLDTHDNAKKMKSIAQWCDRNNWILGPLNMRYGVYRGTRFRFRILWTGIQAEVRCKASKSELVANPNKTLSWKKLPFIEAEDIHIETNCLKLGKKRMLPQTQQ